MGFDKELMKEVHELMSRKNIAPDHALFCVLQEWHRRGWRTLEGDTTPTGLPSYASVAQGHNA